MGSIIVFCRQGFASSRAVASLVELDVANAHDLAAGFDAWQETGLPIATVPAGEATT